MLIEEKKRIIELPIIVIFTEEGINWFIRNNKKLRKYRLADNTVEYGLSLDRFEAPLIQRMIHLNYISTIELSRVEFTSKRNEIMDLSKLILYDFLYRKFEEDVFRKFVNSNFIKKWNRTNPSRIIDENSVFSRAFIAEMRDKYSKEISEINRDVIAPVYDKIVKNMKLSEEEKKIGVLLNQRYLEYINSIIWIILAQLKNAKDYQEIVEDISKILEEYWEKARIAEYFSLMIIELATNAENIRIKEVARELYPDKKNIDSLIFYKDVRENVFRVLNKRRDYLYLVWKISNRRASIGIDNRLKVTLFNREYDYEDLKKKIENKKDLNISEKSLFDFYQELPEDKKSEELGLFYLSYLNEACEKYHVKFDSNVSDIEDSNLTLIDLMVQF